MRAVSLRQPASMEQLRLVSLPDPEPPGLGEILVRIRASTLNFHDYAVVTGRIVVDDGRVPLSDAAGEVLAVGEGVDDFQPGDLVVSTFFRRWLAGPPLRGSDDVPGESIDGYAREFCVSPATAFTRIPRGWSAAEAATLTCAGVTAWRALAINGPVIAGETVLVQGSGGVSIFALQLAKSMGAQVIATSSSDEKLERMKSLGADHVINYRHTPSWGTRARDMSNGGADHVVEVGGAGTLPQSVRACAIGGHIAMIGVLAGLEGPVSTALLMRRQVRLQGLTVGSRQHQLQLVRAVEVNAIRPVIDMHFPLEELAAAFRHQESGAHFGKIGIEV